MDGGADRSTAALARARRVLERLAGTDAYHAKLVAERLAPRWDAAELPAAELLASSSTGGAELRAALAARIAARAGAGRRSLAALLHADRADAARACDALAAGDGTVRSVAAVLLAVLELRALAERRAGDRHPTWIDAEHEHWRAVARVEEARVLAGSLAARAPAPPLAKQVVMVAASDLRAGASLAWTLEARGATTILAEGERALRDMFRYFDVDAIVAALVADCDPMLEAPRIVREMRPQPPLLIAVVPPPARALEGFDVSVPRDPLDVTTVGALLGAAIAGRTTSA